VDANMIKYIAFIKTVESGSLTKAAEALGYSQPGISRMIRDLESSWGFLLLERSHAGLRMTSAGTRLYSSIRKLCEDYEGLATAALEIGGLQSGVIRIGTFSSVATHWLPRMIQAFQADYPGIDYELLMGDYDEIENWIVEGRVDFGFVCLPVHRELETIFLEKDTFLAILPPNHPLTAFDPIPAASLCREPFLLPEKGARKAVTKIFRRYGLSVHTHFTTWDDYAILSMVESGLGVSVLPELILRRNSYQVTIRKLDISAFREIGIAMRSRRELSPAARCFLKYLNYRNEEKTCNSPLRKDRTDEGMSS